ncbi:MAG: pyruvate ferredoxin oxidoreductase, partial [Candidatus Omnitrophica bacterium]|nr:pyruvate ferredoxin oxidoreductase [Candidatus Omnitrophota bacterium]
ISLRGPKYIQIHVPCPLGWGYDPSLTIDIGKKAVLSGLYPLVEYEGGKLTKVFKLSQKIPVIDYIKPQSRFRHLLKDEEALQQLQKVADRNIEYYKLGEV